MQVKVKVFEDYRIVRDMIYPTGNYKEKILNTNDIQRALRMFLNIKSKNDIVKFAKEFGLLNGYDFLVNWSYGLPLLSDLNDKDNEYVGCVLNTKFDICNCTGVFDKEKIKKELNKLQIEKIENISTDGNLRPIELTIFFHGSINTSFYDFDKDIYILTINGNIYESESYELPIDEHIDYSIRDTQGLYGKKNKIIAFESGLDILKKNNKYAVIKYIDYLLYFLERLYDKSNKKMSADYLYRCMGEIMGFSETSKSFFSWISYQSKLLNYAKDTKVLTDGNVSKQEQLEDLLLRNKRFRKRITLEYSYKKKKQNYILEPELVFDSLYDALEWFIVSAGDMIKICKYCNKPFLTSREDTKYCSDNCRSKAKYHRHKKIKHISKKWESFL